MIKFIKKYWALLIVLIVGAYLLIRQKSTNFVDDYKKLKEIDKQKRQKLKNIDQKAKNQHIQNKKEYKNKLYELNLEYEQNKKMLNNQLKFRQKQLKEKSLNELTTEFTKLMNFDVYNPGHSVNTEDFSNKK